MGKQLKEFFIDMKHWSLLLMNFILECMTQLLEACEIKLKAKNYCNDLLFDVCIAVNRRAPKSFGSFPINFCGSCRVVSRPQTAYRKTKCWKRYLFIYLSIYLLIYLFIYLFIYLSINYSWLTANEISVCNENSYVYTHANWRQLTNVEKMKIVN